MFNFIRAYQMPVPSIDDAIAYVSNIETQWYEFSPGHITAELRKDSDGFRFWRVHTPQNMWDVWIDDTRGLYGEC